MLRLRSIHLLPLALLAGCAGLAPEATAPPPVQALPATVITAAPAVPTPSSSPARPAPSAPSASPAQPAPSVSPSASSLALKPSPNTASAVRATPPAAAVAPRELSGPGESQLASVVVVDPLKPRTLDLTAPIDNIWVRIRNGFAIPNLISPLVTERQAWYLTKPEYFLRTVDRSSIYLYHIVEELEKRGMPTELALLPFIESAYNPMAVSSAKAAGMWQFIPSTGKHYNLTQDWWHDDRRDVIASTDAALTYLKTIYDMHGDWHLALASYNWGEGAVKRAIERNVAAGLPGDYLNLRMPDETRYYIPKLQAVKNIIAHPELFNITLPTIDNQPYFTTIVRKRDIDIKTAAQLAEMPLAAFRALNPSFNRPIITGGRTLLVPAEKASIFETNLANHNKPLTSWQAYQVRRGEQIGQIAKKFGMNLRTLREINGIGPRGGVRAGQTLLVQRPGGVPATDTRLADMPQVASTEAVKSVVVARRTPGRTVQSYVVKRGDTLSSIARRFGLSVDSLRSHNKLKSPAINAGQRLNLPM